MLSTLIHGTAPSDQMTGHQKWYIVMQSRKFDPKYCQANVTILCRVLVEQHFFFPRLIRTCKIAKYALPQGYIGSSDKWFTVVGFSRLHCGTSPGGELRMALHDNFSFKVVLHVSRSRAINASVQYCRPQWKGRPQTHTITDPRYFQSIIHQFMESSRCLSHCFKVKD